MDLVSDRAISGAGTHESVWLPWLAGQCIPRVSMSDLCPVNARLVVVAPHPDDEVLACGGLLAMRAQAGLPCLVVAITNGEASHGTVDPFACARLGMKRTKESSAGIAALGLDADCIVRMGIPDGKAADAIFAITMKLLSVLKPNDVVVTTWSLDGHPDHEATNEAARQAAVKGDCRLLEAPVWMWHWATPDDLSIPWHRLVRVELPTNARNAKQEALSRHRSQLECRGDGQGAVLMPSIVERVARSNEYFFV